MDEKIVCEMDGCEETASHLVSHDTRYKQKSSATSISFTAIGACVCKGHIQTLVDELIEEHGEPNGDDVKISITETIPL